MNAGGKCEDVGFAECGRREQTMRAVFARCDWLTVEEVCALLRVPLDIGAARISEWRQEGRVFCVAREGKEYFAGYQFDGFGQPLPVIREVLKALGSLEDGWKIAAWFDFSNGWIDGGDGQPIAPKDMLDRPEAVIGAARQIRGGYVA